MKKENKTKRIDYYETKEVYNYIKENNKSLTLFIRAATLEKMNRELKKK